MTCDVLLLVPRGSIITPAFGYFISRCDMEKESISVQVMDAALERFSLDETFERIQSLFSNVVGFLSARRIIESLTNMPFLVKNRISEGQIVMGGPHPPWIRRCFFPSTCRLCHSGEGEYPFFRIVPKHLKWR